MPSVNEKHQPLPDTAQTDQTPSSILGLSLVLQDHSAIRPGLSQDQELFLGFNSDCSLITALMHAIVQILRQHPRGRQFTMGTCKNHQHNGPEIASPLSWAYTA